MPEHESIKKIDPKMLELLVCPLTKGNLDYDREHNELISKKAKLAYPVREGIPILLPSEARVLE
ncbi:Trm112 family protein [Pseudochrobactrum sp. HB0163]|uniref:Trm112 family protein n=1 Tax=Pseudochrobactrum sp. HB0163 TaxID=3450708 RepID=UPI003F6E2AB3